MQAAAGRLPYIEYLRALSALAVAWYHAVKQVPGVDRFVPPDMFSYGVHVFFVISGFIIVYNHAEKPVSVQVFLIKRVIKIVPLYWAVTALICLLAVAFPQALRTTVVTLVPVIKSFLFIPHYSATYPGQIAPVYLIGWTIDFEVAFYLLFAGAMIVSARYAWGVLAAAMIGLMLMAAFSGTDDPILLKLGDPVVLEFLSGGLIALLYRRGWLTLGWAGVAVCFIGGCVLLYLTLVWPWFGLNLVGASLLVIGALSPVLPQKPLRLGLALGAATYAIYLTHYFMLGGLRIVWMRIWGPVESLPAAALFMLVACGCAALVGWLVYRYAEVPVQRLLRRWLLKSG